jgi:hypothetical protein
VAADETTPVVRPPYTESDLEKTRQSAARLMDNLARKIGSPGLRQTAGSIGRAAHYVQASSLGNVARAQSETRSLSRILQDILRDVPSMLRVGLRLAKIAFSEMANRAGSAAGVLGREGGQVEWGT